MLNPKTMTVLAVVAMATGCGVTVVTSETPETTTSSSADTMGGGGNGGTGAVTTVTSGSFGGGGGTSSVTSSTSTGGVGGMGGSPPTQEVTGACVVRDGSTNMPNFDDPDVGKGYAKQAVPGINDLDGLIAACTDAIYESLHAKHCAVDTMEVMPQVVTYFPDGTPASTTCGGGTCEWLTCP